MSNIFEDDSIPPPKKKTKQKRVISDERRQQLIENLKKGRLTSAKNRAKAKNAKEILKRKKTDYIDKVIRDEVIEQENKKKSYNDLEKELEDLRKQLGSSFSSKKSINVKDITDTETQSDVEKSNTPYQTTDDEKEETEPVENIPVEKPKPVVNQYAENLKNNIRQRFTAKDIIQDQLEYKKNIKYGGSVKRFNY